MTWDTTIPSNSDFISLGDDKIRELKTDLQTSFIANDINLGNEGVFPVNTTTPQYRYRGLKGTTAQRPTSGNYGFYFNTTTVTLQRDNGSSWEDIIQPPRISLHYVGTLITGSSIYLDEPSEGTSECGYLMHRAGSIVGYIISGITGNFNTQFTGTFKIRKNGSDIISPAALVWTANNQNQDATGTFSIGTNSFVVGDRLEIFGSTTAPINNAASIRANLEVAFTS